MKTKVNSRTKIIFIWAILIFSSIVLVTNFTYLEFWFADRDPGYQNGFHLLNTQYSVIYWSMKISYVSCLIVVLWSGFEVAGIYDEKYKPSFRFRYVAVFWITATMVGESFILPSAMGPRLESMYDAIFNGGDWFGSYGFFFSFLDFFQFFSIHITVPIMVLTYVIMYRDVELAEGETKKLFIIMNVMMISWMLWSYFWTALGEMAPYAVIDATPDNGRFDHNGMNLVWQTIILTTGWIGTNIITYGAIYVSEKYNWNGNKENISND